MTVYDRLLSFDRGTSAVVGALARRMKLAVMDLAIRTIKHIKQQRERVQADDRSRGWAGRSWTERLKVRARVA